MEEFNHFEEMAHQVDVAVGKLVRRAAFGIERSAKKRAAVKTGFMRNSIYSRTEDQSGYTKASAAAGRRNKDATPLPEVSPPAHNEAWVAVGAEYAIYVEFGTHKMAAKPYFYPAVEEIRPKFLAALQRLMDRQKEVEIDITGEIAGDLPGAP